MNNKLQLIIKCFSAHFKFVKSIVLILIIIIGLNNCGSEESKTDEENYCQKMEKIYGDIQHVDNELLIDCNNEIRDIKLLYLEDGLLNMLGVASPTIVEENVVIGTPVGKFSLILSKTPHALDYRKFVPGEIGQKYKITVEGKCIYKECEFDLIKADGEPQLVVFEKK